METGGIPTRFKGVNFRSRLEAKWAHVFECFRWDWLYEPFDLDGWIPDFLIRCQGGIDLLVDIKPMATFSVELLPREIAEKIDLAVEKLAQPHHVSILGVEPMGDPMAIGWIRPAEDGCPAYGWDVAILATTDDDFETGFGTGRIGLCQELGGWTDVISGGHTQLGLRPDHERLVRSAFRESLNRVQWNAKAPRHIADVLANFRV